MPPVTRLGLSGRPCLTPPRASYRMRVCDQTRHRMGLQRASMPLQEMYGSGNQGPPAQACRKQTTVGGIMARAASVTDTTDGQGRTTLSLPHDTIVKIDYLIDKTKGALRAAGHTGVELSRAQIVIGLVENAHDAHTSDAQSAHEGN